MRLSAPKPWMRSSSEPAIADRITSAIVHSTPILLPTRTNTAISMIGSARMKSGMKVNAIMPSRVESV